MSASVSERLRPPWEDEGARARLAGWLRENVGGDPERDLSVELLSGGSSASVLAVLLGRSRIVLRTTAWPPRPDSLRALEREARVLRALASTKVPHPRFIAYCDDAAVFGAPFLVMEHVEGWLGSGVPAPPFAKDIGLKHATAFALIDGLAELALVDPAEIGLSDFGRPENFLLRQVDRWATLMDQHRSHPEYGDRKLLGYDEVGEWLRQNIPDMQRVSLIHGDGSYSNVIFGNEPAPRLAAIIDWEIATLGDPLLDLGRALYPFPSRDGSSGYSLAIDHADYPPREDLAEHYARRTGMSVAALDYYLVLSMYKLAALIEFNHVKRQSEPAGSMAHRIADFIPQLVGGALDIAQRSRI